VLRAKSRFWIGSAKGDLLEFPEAVKDEIGLALSVAQFGGKHPKAKPWKGEGPGVLEIVEDHRGDTYRAVYTVRFENAAYVLHAFQKKSPKGIKTAGQTWNWFLEDAGSQARITRHDMANGRNNEAVVQSSGNVFADLGLRDAGEKRTRVRLAVAINQIIESRRLSQTAAARLLDINQPKISALVNYRLEGFSVERLMNFLNALDRDVEIVIRKKPASKRAARIVVTGAQLSHVG
jgi:phage-related protein/predicted XRE-type DNA-binding protein